jgi:branched-chain amino acid transport system permease protein
MTELQAERAGEPLSVPRIEAKSNRLRYLDVLIAVAAFAVLTTLPFLFSSKALLDFVIRCSAFGLFATSLNLLVGYTGMISFGHGMFFGLGAYGFGLIMQRSGVPVPVAFLCTLLITTFVAAVIGAICVRLKEIYFAFVTLAFQMLIHSVILSWPSLTGGDQGLRGGIPRPVFLGIDLSNHMHLYVMSCALLVIGLLLMRQIAQSPFGYTLRMIRDNASRASFIGIDVWRAKLTIFVLAALFASTGGIIMSLFVSGAYPEFAYWTISGEGIFINMLGGVTTFLGPMVGTVLLLILNDTVTRLTEHYGIVLGIVILFFAIGLRRGLMDFVVEWYEQRRDGAKERG